MAITTLVSIALSFSQCGAPQAKALPPDLASLVDAERSFAHASLETGIRASFLHYLADDAVVFRPDPEPGRKYYTKRAETGAILLWEPEFASVSSSNDLGYTTGPWVFRADSTSAPNGFGHYVAVWRRGADREWEVAVAAGISHAAIARPQGVATSSAGKAPDVVTQPEALAAIQQEERDFVEAAARGIEDAFDMWGADDVRLFRDGELPTVGRDAARALLMKQPGTRRMQTTAAEASRDGDLGFTYGRCDLTYNEKVSTSYYLRIWKRMPDATWKIVLDLDSPAGEP